MLPLLLLCGCAALDIPDPGNGLKGAEPAATKPGSLLRSVQNVLYPPIKLFREVRARRKETGVHTPSDRMKRWPRCRSPRARLGSSFGARTRTPRAPTTIVGTVI